MTEKHATDHEPTGSRRAESTARHLQSVHALLERRTDLEGVVPMAELIRDAVHWAA